MSQAHITWLEEAARYFENRSTGGEDRAHWANVYNAENCRKIATALSAQEAEIAELIVDRDLWKGRAEAAVFLGKMLKGEG